MSLMDVMWLGLVFAVAVALFVLKYEIQGLEDDLTVRQTEIDKHTQAIHVLEAEWTFLNDPSRLRRLGADQLQLAPVSPDRIVPIGALPYLEIPRATSAQDGDIRTGEVP